MRSRLNLTLWLLLLVVPGRILLASDDFRFGAVSELAIPALAGARTPRLHAGQEKLTLSWVRGDEAQAQLEFSQLSSNGWSPVNFVAQGDGWLVNPHDYAQLLPISSQIYLAVWLELTSFRDYFYRFNTRISLDAGKTWKDTGWPEQLVDYGQHGFAVAALSDELIKFFWISSYRNDARLLRADVSLDGRWSIPEVVDERVCNCCHLSLSESFLLAYRDRSETEIRDIAVIKGARKSNDARIIHPDRWEISGCPVNAPSIAENDDWIALSWFSAGAENGESGNRLAISRNLDGLHWDADRLETATLGQVDSAWLDMDTLALASVSSVGDITLINLQIFRMIAGKPELQKHLEIPVDSIIGAPSMVSFQGQLYLAYYSSQQSATKLLKISPATE